jgi:hypothetical protein
MTEIIEAERRGYERAMRHIVEREGDVGADWDGLSNEVDILLRKARGEDFLEKRDEEEITAAVESIINGQRKQFFERVSSYLYGLATDEDPDFPVRCIANLCRDYRTLIKEAREQLPSAPKPLGKVFNLDLTFKKKEVSEEFKKGASTAVEEIRAGLQCWENLDADQTQCQTYADAMDHILNGLTEKYR